MRVGKILGFSVLGLVGLTCRFSNCQGFFSSSGGLEGAGDGQTADLSTAVEMTKGRVVVVLGRGLVIGRPQISPLRSR